LNPNLSTCSF